MLTGEDMPVTSGTRPTDIANSNGRTVFIRSRHQTRIAADARGEDLVLRFRRRDYGDMLTLLLVSQFWGLAAIKFKASNGDNDSSPRGQGGRIAEPCIYRAVAYTNKTITTLLKSQ